MRVMVVHAHPVESSYNRALYNRTLDELKKAGHELDPLNLYDENFEAILSREERLNYHEVPGNLTPAISLYVDRLMKAEGVVFVHPVWNYGYPAILKGYFDRIFLPGVSFVLEGGGDRGKLRPNLTHVKKVAFVTTYGGDRLRTIIMGDPPRKLAHRWAWATFGTKRPPLYLALYDMNNCTEPQLKGFLDKVGAEMRAF